MSKMPRIWLDYTSFLSSQGYVTRTREAFDRALQSLPISQHDLVWPQYLKFARREGVPVRTRAGIYRRYVMYDPSEVEEYVEVLVRGGSTGRPPSGSLGPSRTPGSSASGARPKGRCGPICAEFSRPTQRTSRRRST